MEHQGHLQAGGVESGQPWVKAIADVTEEEIRFVVNQSQVARFGRNEIMLAPEGEIFRVVAPNETLFFRPADSDRFSLDLKTDRTAAEEIQLASVSPRVSAAVAQGEHSKVTAGILAILLGFIGIHKFYLGQTGMGVLYLLLFWTGIPALIGLVEGIVYLVMSDEEFARRYG